MPFYLKNPPNKKGEHLIILHFNFHRRRFKMSTGKSILPEHWDEKKNWPKRTFKYYPQYNALMLRLEEAVHNAYHELTVTKIPSLDELRQAVEVLLRPDNSQNLYQYCLQFVENRKANYKLGSIQIYQRTAEHVGKFDQFAAFDRVDWEWLDRFKNYLFALDYEQNTAAKIYSTFKMILNHATGTGVNKNMRYLSAKSIQRVETTEVFLDEKELDKLYRTKMPNVEKEIARDKLIISAYTGVRVSDIPKINDKTFFGGKLKHFRIVSKKVNKTIDIPVHHYVLEIMLKWDFRIPKQSDQKYNVHLKEICELAGITQEIVVTSYPGGKVKQSLKRKCDMVSSHTGRRSFACNMYINGVSEETIMACGGWSSTASFRKYLRLTPQQHLEVAYKSGFFEERKLKVI